MFRKITALLLILSLLFCVGCRQSEPANTEPSFSEITVPVTDPTGTAPTDSTNGTVPTEPPATEPPATEPPATEPPATEPPATEPPATEPPATEPPVTEPPVTEPPAPQGDTLQIISLEMTKRYGECTLIKIGDFEILVDGGEKDDSANVKALLQEYVTDGVLELLIGTHAHSDHIGGISYTSTLAVLDEIEMIIDCGGSNMNTTQVWGNYKSVVEYYVNQGAAYYAISDVIGSSLETMEIAENVTLTFLNNRYYGIKSANPNDTSIGFYLQYYDTYLCMFGDAEEKAEASFMALNRKFTTEADTVIYKANHHGSNGSNKEDFLNWLQPDYCLISSAIVNAGGTVNFDQHPYYDAVTRIAKHTQEIYWNGITGTLHFEVTEDSVTVYGEGRTRNYTYNGAAVDPESEKNVTYLQSKWYQAGVESKGWKEY